MSAVEQCVNSKCRLISASEVTRVAYKVEALIHTNNLCGMPRWRINVAPLSFVDNRVMVYRQIYDIFGDGQEMSELFLESMVMWKLVAVETGGIYFCLGPAALETIIKKYFPEAWPIYADGLRFPHIQSGPRSVMHPHSVRRHVP